MDLSECLEFRKFKRPWRAIPPVWCDWATYSVSWSATVIDYETWCQIRDHLDRRHLSVAQTAQALGLDPRTVAHWAQIEFRRRNASARLAAIVSIAPARSRQ